MTKKGKFSIYVEPKLRKDIELLSQYDDSSITETISNALERYVSSRVQDLEFLRHQEEERQARRQQSVNDRQAE